MALVGRTLGFEAPARPEEAEPTLGQEVGSAFYLDSAVYAAWDFYTRERFQPDPNFNVSKFAHRNHPNLVGDPNYKELATARSEAEFYALKSRTERELEARKTLEASGWSGVAWSIAAGVLDPTMFIPLVGAYTKGARAIAEGAALTGGAILAQEAALQETQTTRTREESLFAIGTGIALGGILGGVVGRVRAANLRKMEEALTRDWEHPTGGDKGISVATPRSGAPNKVGAAADWEAPTGIKGIFGGSHRWGVGKLALEEVSPVTRQLTGMFGVGRWMMAQISDAGLQLEGISPGRVAAYGGTVQARRLIWNANLHRALAGLDDIFADYVFGANQPSLVRGPRAALAAYRSPEHLAQKQFNEKVSEYLRDAEEWPGILGDEKTTAAVRKAGDLINKEIYEPMLRELQKVGIIDENVKTLADSGYLNRVYNIEYIKAHQKEFLDLIEGHLKEKRGETFRKSLQKFNLNQAETKQLAEDAELDADASTQLAKALNETLAARTGTDNPMQAILDEIKSYRETAKALEEEGATELALRYRNEANRLRKENAKELSLHEQGTSTLKRRLRGLSRTIEKLETTRDKKLAKIDRAQELQIGSLDRLNRSYVRFLSAVGKASPEEVEKRLFRLEVGFKNTLEVLEKQETRLDEIFLDNNSDMGAYLGKQATISANFDKLNRLAERIENLRVQRAEAPEVVQELNEGYAAMLESVRDLNNRRFARIQRLEKEVEKLKPEEVRAQHKAKVENLPKEAAEFRENALKQGFDDVDFEAETFTDIGARNQAHELVNKIISAPFGRLVNYDLLLQEERGAALKRTLDIASTAMVPYLENNIEKLVRIYVRTLAPDIEIARRFGDVRASEWMTRLNDEYNMLIDASTSKEAKEAAIKATKEELKKAEGEAEKKFLEDRLRALKANYTSAEINKAAEASRRDFEGVLGRLRHTWGIPADPNSWDARLGRIAMNLNTLIYMGKVVISSVADPGIVIMKHGPVAFFNVGLKNLVTNFNAFKLSAREAQLAGVGNDVFLHTRAYEIMNTMEDFTARSKFERGLDYLTGKVGILGMFDYWNQFWKGFTSVLHNAEVMDSIQTVMQEGHKGAKSLKEANEYLAHLNLDPQTVADVWRLVTSEGGGGISNNVWLPNTEAWMGVGEKLGMNADRVREVLDTYRAASVRVIESTVITPGVERPLILDKSLAWRLITQFKSFTASSTQMVLMAGLQGSKARFAAGVAAQLALGMLSYKLYLATSGNQKKGSDSWEKYVDEAIDRSGFLGIFAEARAFGTTVPWLNDYLAFSGQSTTRYGGHSLYGKLVGPTGSTVENATNFIAGLGDPTQGTLNYGRKIMPLQNMWWLDKLLDWGVENSGLPEKRKRKKGN